jgi:hypothetical protein
VVHRIVSGLPRQDGEIEALRCSARGLTRLRQDRGDLFLLLGVQTEIGREFVEAVMAPIVRAANRICRTRASTPAGVRARDPGPS